MSRLSNSTENGLVRGHSSPGPATKTHRPRAATLHIQITPLAGDNQLVLTPRNKLASAVHFERTNASLRSPRVIADIGDRQQQQTTADGDGERHTVVSTAAALAMLATRDGSVDKRMRERIEFTPPTELLEEIRAARRKATRNWRRQRRQTNAAAVINSISSSSNGQPPATVEEATSNLVAVVKVVAVDIDNSDSGSDSDEDMRKALVFYPIEVDVPARRNRLKTASGDRQQHQQQRRQRRRGKQHSVPLSRHQSLEIVDAYDIVSDDEFDRIDGGDDDGTSAQSSTTPRDTEPATSHTPESSSATTTTTTTIEPEQQQQQQQQQQSTSTARMDNRKKFIVMQQLLTSGTCKYNFIDVYDTVWHGLNAALRDQFWSAQLHNQAEGAVEENELPTFTDIIASGTMTLACYDAVVLDIYRTFPYLTRFNAEFDKLLYQALIAYAIYRPDIGYIQGMPFVMGTIVLTLPRQEQQLRMMEHVTRHVLPFYFDTDGVGWRVDASVLVAYMHERSKKYLEFYEARFHESFYAIAIIVACRWYTRLFVSILQGSQALRLWDMIMLRGPVTLIQFTLQVFKYAYKHKIDEGADSMIDFVMRIETKLGSMSSIDAVYRTKLEDKHIPVEDFELRRRAAARIEFQKLKNAAMKTTTTTTVPSSTTDKK